MPEINVNSGTTVITDYSNLEINPDLKKLPVGNDTVVILTADAIDALNKLLGNDTKVTGDLSPLTAPSERPPLSADEFSISSEDCSADIVGLMALFEQLAQVMRNANRELRATELNGQVTALLASADDLKKAADLRLTAGIVQGACQIAGGVLQAGMSAASAMSTIKGAKLESDSNEWAGKAAEETGADQASLDRQRIYGNIAKETAQDAKIAGANGAKFQGYGQAAGGITGGIGGIIAASINHEADLADIDSKKAEANAKTHETASSQANEMMQQMMDIIRGIFDKVQSMEQARQQTSSAILRA